MVMARRPDVKTAASIAAIDTLRLAEQTANALMQVSFRALPDSADSRSHRIGASITREVVRTFMGYCSSLPIDEFRSILVVLDECRPNQLRSPVCPQSGTGPVGP